MPILGQLVSTKKPTGTAEVPENVQWAWDIEELINQKAAILPIDDPELADEPSDEDEVKAEVIEISEEEGEKKSSKASIKGGSLVKAYQVNPPLSKRARVASATDALSTISTMFSPDVMQQRDASRMAHQLQMAQLSTYQVEIRELHSRIDILQDRLMEETRRADKAESELQLLRMMQTNQSSSRFYQDYNARTPDYCRHRDSYHHPSSHRHSPSYSPQASYRRLRSSYHELEESSPSCHSHRHPYSQSPAAVRSSKHHISPFADNQPSSPTTGLSASVLASSTDSSAATESAQ